MFNKKCINNYERTTIDRKRQREGNEKEKDKFPNL